MTEIVYGDRPETILRSKPRVSATKVNHVLLGTFLKVEGEDGDWYSVDPLGLGKPGWVKKSDVREKPVLKIFFVDVGQGDAAIVESPEGIMLIDGGPNSNFFKFMEYRFRPILKADGEVAINAIVVSHPDWDH